MDIPNWLSEISRRTKNLSLSRSPGENVLDEALLRTLQSIKDIEDDPSLQFRTEKIDLTTFTPKYPNVVVVDQQVEQSQLPHSLTFGDFGMLPSGILSADAAPGLAFITNRLSVALELAFCGTTLNPKFEMTIILKEGLYVDPLWPLNYFEVLIIRGNWPSCPSPTLAIEIVGLNDVRLLLDHDSAITFELKIVNLILRNVHVYDYRKNPPPIPMFFIVGASCYLIGVKLYSLKVGVVQMGKIGGSRLFLKGCSLIGNEFRVLTGGGVNASNCLIAVRTQLVCAYGSTFIACNVVYRQNTQITVGFNSKCVLDSCKFETPRQGITSTFQPALFASSQSEVECKKTEFLGYSFVAYGCGSGSSLSFRNCNILHSDFPFWIEENANLSVTDSDIHASQNLLLVYANVKGKVELLRKRYDCPMLGWLDQISTTPVADVEVQYVRRACFDMSELGPRDKRLSTGSKYMHSLRFDGSLSKSEAFRLHAKVAAKVEELGVKMCSKCGKVDMNEPELDFRYCGNCRTVCYCSKECQLAHWEDHGLMCKGKKGLKSSDDKSKSKKGTGSRPKEKK